MIKGKTNVLMAIFALVAVLLTATVSAVEYETRADGNFSRQNTEDVLNQGDMLDLDVIGVKINGDLVENGDEIRLSLDRDADIEVKVEMIALADVHGAAIEAEIYGDDHYQIDDQTETFDVKNKTLYIKTLDIALPDIMEVGEYDLRVTVAGRTGAVKTYNYLLRIDAQKHSVLIKDVTLNPENSVMAGRALLSVVRIRNSGEKTEESVKVTVSIPELGVSAVDYVDDIDPDDSVSTEELYMRIPSNADSGMYDVNIKVEYDEGFKSVAKKMQIDVVGGDSEDDSDSDSDSDRQPAVKQDKTTIMVGSQTQDLARGQGGAIYPITISNEGSNSKSYTVSIAGTDAFAEVRVSPSTLIVVDGGKTDSVYVYLTAKEAAQIGSYTFSIDVSSNGQSLQKIPLSANVVEGEGAAGGWDSVKKGLEIGLIILVVLLVILGLIIAFTKMKGDDDENEEEESEVAGQTYY